MRTPLLLFAALLLSLSALAQTGRHYTPRDTFTRFTSDKCFDLTREEGERAFRANDWETAAALFRAAKNCADADEKERREMSRRISDSRKAAIAELVESERVATLSALEATRIARNAIATNRANDALLLLKDGHRSLAFRLADFADRYIAPSDGEPNANCRQAMLDAWNYLPYYHSWMRNAPDVQVPFCFQLADMEPRGTQLRYQQRKGQARLYAFSLHEHLLRSWSGDLTEAAEPLRIDTSLTGFDVSPDGQTLLFNSNRRWVLWRSPTNFFPIETSGALFSTFSPSGDVFYHLDRSQIRAVPMSKVFTSRGSRAYQRNYKSNVGETLSPAELYAWPQVETDGLLAFAVKGTDVYLAYPDRVLVAKADTTLVCPMPFTLPDDTRPEQMKFWLRDNLLTYANDTVFARFKLPASGSGPVVQEAAYGEQLIAFDPHMLATHERPSDPSAVGRIFFRENSNTTISHFSQNHTDGLIEHRWYTGAMSPDGTQCAALSVEGELRVFDLEKTLTGTALPYFKTSSQYQHLQFTPDGQHFVVPGSKLLEVFSTNDLENPVAARPTYPAGPDGLLVSNTWVAHQCSADSLELFQFQTGRSWKLPWPIYGNKSGALSHDGRQFAYADSTGVHVLGLNGNAPPLTRSFNNLIVTGLAFVPQSTKLMLMVNAGSYQLDARDIKFWDTDRPDREPEALLLPDFSEDDRSALSPDGRWGALTNQAGTRIFELTDLTEEYNFLRAQNQNEAAVTTMTFSPNGRLLVMGYQDGHTIAWDIATRRMAYRLAPATAQAMPVVQLNFSDNGLELRQVLLPAIKDDSTGRSATNTFTTRLLDFEEMRLHLSQGTRQLVALSPNQILDYDLESALSYPGNFERLAKSGDMPLIRSFFDFYQQQAHQSNNSAQVRQYCDRAFQLYQNLDPGTHESLRDAMLGMYNGLIWKLIQRNKPDEAASVVQHVSRHFGSLLQITRWNGHITLLRGDEQPKSAANYYVDWLIRSAEEEEYINQDFASMYGILGGELRQLNTYGLLRHEQKQMLCGLFGEFGDDALGEDWCLATDASSENAGTDAAVPTVVELSLDPITQQRWHIFQGLSQLDFVTSFSEKTRLLQGYLDDAKRLARQSPAHRATMEPVALELARTHIAHGEFEQGNDRSLRLYAQAARTVQDVSPFKKHTAEYWDILSNVRLLTGNIYLARGNTADAVQAYQECQKSLQSLQTAAENLPAWIWSETIRARLGDALTQFGMARLLENRPDDADTLFEIANRVLPGGLPQMYTGHAAILRGDRDGALLNYGGIFDAQQLGQVLAEIERMAERVPARHDALLTFAADLRRTTAVVKTDIDSVATQYWYANLQTRHFATVRQWGKAQQWSREELRCMEKLKDAPDDWLRNWFDAHQDAAYYHLFGGSRDIAALSAAIRYSRTAEKRLAEVGGYFGSDLLKTNLAHALLLRNGPGDREAALLEYRAFMQSHNLTADNWEVLQKDFRDLREAGVQWPADMPQVMQQINPRVKLPLEEK